MYVYQFIIYPDASVVLVRSHGLGYDTALLAAERVGDGVRYNAARPPGALNVI